MFNKLKELVFGLGEFEKTKIDVRYELINNYISSLRLNEIFDFEILEDCISKIKDQLRVKSSNLNKIIADPSKSLKKRDVNEVLEKMSKVKYDFLERAFSLIKRENTIMDELKSNAHELDSRIENLEKKESSASIPVKDDDIVYVNDYFKVKISNGKVPYLIVDFARDVDYAFLKSLSGYLFEEYSAMGTNIIVEKNKAMVVPRFDNDNLFEIPRIDVDIDEVFKKINERDLSKAKSDYEEPSVSVSKKDEVQEDDKQNDEEKDSGYVEIDKKPLEFKTKKHEEDSLDAILMGKEKKRVTPKPKPEDDKNDVVFEKDDSIVFEKKEEEVKEPEIVIERKEIREGGIGNRDEGKEIEDGDVNSKLQTPNSQPNKFEIYRDDKIVVYLKEDSKVLGELVIEPLAGDINESDFSYMWIFSKIFSSVLFEVTNSAGTNILMDYSDNKIRIVPRIQDDNLDLLWTPKQESDDFLEQIKDKLIKVMNEAIGGKAESKKEENALEVKEKEVVQESLKEDSERQKKVNHLLEHLRKIP